MNYKIQFSIINHRGGSYTYIVKANLPAYKVVEVPEYGLYN